MRVLPEIDRLPRVAAACVFEHLKQHARFALEALRDTQVDPVRLSDTRMPAEVFGAHEIARWADDHDLSSPWIVAHAAHLWRNWNSSPAFAADLTWPSITNVVHVATGSRHLERFKAGPNPFAETRAQWMKRAAELYNQAAAALSPPMNRKRTGRPTSEDILDRNCEWLVLHRVNKQTFLDISVELDAEESTIGKGVHAAEKILGMSERNELHEQNA